MSHYENTSAEEAKQETFRCVILAGIVVFGGFCAMIYGLAWMSSVTVTAEDLYARKRMENRITTLENHTHIFEIRDHTHKFWTGKIK